MGKVMTKLKLTNIVDQGLAMQGLLRPDQIRSVEVDALVDTGATSLAIPADLAAALGVPVINRLPIRLADGTSRMIPAVGGLWIEILGRGMSGDAYVLPDGSTPLIGQLQLEAMDFVVDPRSQEIIPNPAHPDGWMIDLLSVA
jgi:clan AA aspartic protease